MPYTVEDYQKYYVRKYINRLPINDLLKEIPVNDLLEGISADDRMKGIPLNERLKGIPADDLLELMKKRFSKADRKKIEDFLNELNRD